ncbi:MAG: class I SAM-dependent methyltransferase [Ignavibacteria bacterium]
MAFIPKSLRVWVKQKIVNTMKEEQTRNEISDSFGAEMKPVYFPYKANSESYIIHKPAKVPEMCEQGLPVPPKELRLGYGNTAEEYLNGKIQIKRMLEILKKNKFEITSGNKILDFGCGAGRMIRWLKTFSKDCEIWGTDISSEHIYWANQYLKPPFNFATTTTIPHLPFEDGYFNFIYSGSVFTHIDDLADAWFLELRRVCSKDAFLYITIQDKHTIKLLDNEYKGQWLSSFMNDMSVYRENKNDFDVIVGGRGPDSQVFYDIDYLKRSLNTFFEIISVEEEAYGYQTALVLRKK